MEDLANSLVDAYAKHCRAFDVSGFDLSLLTEQLPSGNKLLEFTLEQTACEIGYEVQEKGFKAYREDHPCMFSALIAADAENAIALLGKAFKYRPQDKAPAFMSSCRWHTHLTTPKCDEKVVAREEAAQRRKRLRAE